MIHRFDIDFYNRVKDYARILDIPPASRDPLIAYALHRKDLTPTMEAQLDRNVVWQEFIELIFTDKMEVFQESFHLRILASLEGLEGLAQPTKGVEIGGSFYGASDEVSYVKMVDPDFGIIFYDFDGEQYTEQEFNESFVSVEEECLGESNEGVDEEDEEDEEGFET